jgi:membrane protein
MPQDVTAHDIWPLLKQSGNAYVEDKVPKMAAALAYYTAIALAPLFIIIIKVIAVVLGPNAAKDQLRDQLAHFTDPHVAAAIQSILVKASQPGSGDIATVISIIISLIGGSSMFVELQDSLDTIWEVRPRPGRGIWGVIRDRVPSLLMVLGIALLLLISMFVSAFITGISGTLIQHTIGMNGLPARIIAYVVDVGISTGIMTLLFAALFRFLPDVIISWKNVWLGALVTAVLFQFGKYALSVYLTKASPGSAYGAAGSLVALLVWVFYSAQIVFFGAEFTRIYANQFGGRIIPSRNAQPLTQAMREQQGVPRAPQKRPSNQTARPQSKSSAAKRPIAPRPHAPAAVLRQHSPKQRAPASQRPSSTTVDHQSHVARYLPVFTGVVLGRLVWKRYHRPDSTGQSPKVRWRRAMDQWKKVAKLFVSDAADRYAMTHGPQGRRGPSWTDLTGDTASAPARESKGMRVTSFVGR